MEFTMTYNEYIDAVENGCKFKINLIDKKAYLKRQGRNKRWKRVHIQNLIDPVSWDIVEKLYRIYKYSIPSQVKLNGNNPYFKATSIDELKDSDIVCGEQRNIAQAMLELYILIADLKMDEGKWFWQSEKDNDLVVLKKWLKESEGK